MICSSIEFLKNVTIQIFLIYFVIIKFIRSCSKKLEELEGERKKLKEEKKKKKSKNKKLSLKLPNSMDDILEPICKFPKTWKKKAK